MNGLIFSELCTVLNVSPSRIDLDTSFIQNGGQSLSAAALVAKCKLRGHSLTLRTVLTSLNLRDILNSARPDVINDTELSPMERNLDTSRSLSSMENVESLRPVTPVSAAYKPSPRNETASTDALVQSFGRPYQHDQFEGALSTSQHSSLEALKARSKLDTSARTIRSCSSPVASSRSASPDPSFDLLNGSLTEMQLSLIHGSMKTPGMNVIVHGIPIYTKDIPMMKLAWKTVIEQEPIFQMKALLPKNGKAFNWHVENEDNRMNEGFTYNPSDGSQIGSFFDVIAQESTANLEPRSTIIWRVHHALVDGYSASIIFNKVRRVAAGESVQPGPNFAETVKEFKLLQNQRRGEGNAYWAKIYAENADAASQLLLHHRNWDVKLDQSETDVKTINIGPYYYDICRVARDSNITPSIFFNAAWALVLAKHSDSDTVMFGAVLSGRDLPLSDGMTVVGPLVNTLPLFITLDRKSSVKVFLQSVFRRMLELREFQWTTPDNGYSRNFQSALAVQSVLPESLELSSPSIGRPHTRQSTEIPLSVVVDGDETVLFLYHREKFSQQNMNTLVVCYEEALQLLLHTHTTIDVVMEGLLSCSLQALLRRFGNCFSGLTTRPSIKQDLVTLFESSVSRCSEETAIERGDFCITYRSLDQAATNIAMRLKGRINAGDVVCVHSDRSINWIVAIYGILKAGGVYCSLDSGLPPELRNQLYSLAGAKVYLTPSTAQTNLCPASCDTCWPVESILAEDSVREPKALYRKASIPWSTAYLCFTSGSTGTPKGVLCTHEGLVAFQSDLQVRLFAQPGVKISQIMSPAFDGSIHEIFSALSYGATLVLPADENLFGPLNSADSAILTPSMARVLEPRYYDRLKNVYLVGEPVPQAVCDKWASTKQLYNMYGPTEGTCGATIKRLSAGSPVNIGSPNPTTRIYILDSHQSFLPPGMIGEIFLAGVQVAKGYVSLPEQTADRFLPDTICRNGEYMYKTGDRGYWNELGEIICLGRNDREIKLRGHRLDMNDLEIRMLKADPRLEAVAVAPNGEHLVAMVQPASTNIDQLRARLRSVLPSYATMQHITAAEQLPVTSAGKIDYSKVSQSQQQLPIRPLVAPKTVTEKAISKAFKYILKLEEKATLTAESDFISLGGHSLAQLSLASHLSKAFALRIPLRLIIENSSLGAMARCVDSFMTCEKPALPRGPSLTAQQVSPIEQEWLQKYSIDLGSACFNVCFACNFEGRAVNRPALASAWNTVLARHKLLRGRYETGRGKSHVRVDADCAPLAERVNDFSLWKEVNRPFCVDRASPIRVLITKTRLLVVMSHIVADYTAVSLLLKQASELYNGQKLGPIGPTYPNSTVWYDSVPPCNLEFWSNFLEGCDENPSLLGRQQDRVGYRGSSTVSRIPLSIYKNMLAHCSTTRLSLQQLVMAAAALCLQFDSAATDIVLGSPYINRNSEEDLGMVGLFLEPLPVRIKYSHPLPGDHGELESDTAEKTISFLDAVRHAGQSALAHAMPWHQLLAHLGITPRFPNHPLFDVMVTFHDNRQSLGLRMAAPEFESCFVWSEGAKFKLMFEFSAVSEETLILRLEYDNDCISKEEVTMLQELIPRALELLVRGKEHGAIKDSLKASASRVQHGACKRLETENLFGKRLCDL